MHANSLNMHRLPHLLVGIALAVAIVALLAIVWAFMSSSTPATTINTPPNTWRNMTLDYRVDGQMMQLVYQDQRHWRQVGGGATAEMAGAEYRTLSVGTEHVQQLANGPVVPQRWLHPRFMATLIDKHYVALPGASDNTVTYQQIATRHCSELAGIDIPQPTACAHGTTFQQTERFIVRTNITPPLGVAAEVETDGVVNRYYEVTSVSFGD